MNIGDLVKKLRENIGRGVDAVVPGDQSRMYRPAPPSRPAPQPLLNRINQVTGFQPPRPMLPPPPDSWTRANINSSIGGMRTIPPQGYSSAVDTGWATPYRPVQPYYDDWR